MFLGGHSTGGTLAVLAAASGNTFAGVFAFGPIDDPRYYDSDCPPRSLSVAERRPRTPSHWVRDIRVPTWLIEGEHGNSRSVELLARSSARQGHVRPVIVDGHDHFDVLRPGLEVIVDEILTGRGPAALEISGDAIAARAQPAPWPARVSVDATQELLLGAWALDPMALRDHVGPETRAELETLEFGELEYLEFRDDGAWSYVVNGTAVGNGSYRLTSRAGSVVELAITVGGEEGSWRIDFHTSDAIVSTGETDMDTMTLRRLR